MKLLNPFKFGEAVSGKYFSDREDELRMLSIDLLSGQNIILYSPRRYGKTSLVLETLNRLKKEGCLCIYVDLFAIPTKRKFAQKLSSAIASGTSKKIEEVIKILKEYLPSIIPKITIKGKEAPEFEIEFGDREKDIDDVLEKLYDTPNLIAKKRKKRVVVVFDEFQEIRNLDGENIEKALRTKIQYHQNVAYLFMGSKRHLMDRIFNTKSSAFYKTGKFIYLKKIPDGKFAQFIKKRFKDTTLKIEDKEIQKILKITQCHPYYTQMLCHEIWNESLEKKLVRDEEIENALKFILLNQSYTFTIIWDGLSAKQRNLLIALANEEETMLHSQNMIFKYELGSPATVNKSIKILEKKEIIEKEDKKYAFSDLFFKEWIKEIISK